MGILEDLQVRYNNISTLISIKFLGCILEAYFISVGFCASGLSVVVIALDRYLLMCHGYFASWSKTGILVLICWFIALVFPALVIFPTLPDSIILANGLLCHPNYTSQSSITKGILLTVVLSITFAVLILIFSYASVFYKYNSILLRKQKRQAKALTLSEKSQKLLFKLCILTANTLISFIPLLVYFIAMMISQADAPEPAFLFILFIFEIGLFLNPILIYLLDAKMKLSVDEMFGFVKKKTVSAAKKNDRVDHVELNDRPAPQAAVISEPPAELEPEEPGLLTKTIQLHLRRNSTDTAPLEIKAHDLKIK